MRKNSFFLSFSIASVLFCAPLVFAESLVKSGPKSTQPITINGDTVEYSADSQEVSATGNVEIISGDTKLTCSKLVVNTQTKEGTASGHARLQDAKGIIEGEKINYNFQTKKGTIVDAQFRASPFFGKARNIDKEDEKEYVAHYGYFTTCSFDRPHYRIASKQINVIPKELIQTKDDCLYIGTFPIMSIARFNKMFDKPMMHVSVLPGKRKDWGPYLLSVWEYNLSETVNGRGYLDYRNKLGWAEGFGVNYNNTPVGNGDFKFYFTDELTSSYSNPMVDTTRSFQRYLLRFRQKWDIDTQTNLVTEVFKIRDEKRKLYDSQANMLKDYFYREFEKDVQPLSYALFHHSFSHASFDFLLQKRTNNWYDQIDRMPQATFSLPSLQVGDSPFYFTDSSTFVTFNKKATTAPTTADDLTVTRFDTTNTVSIPMKVAFLRVSPFVKVQETVYDKGANGSTLPGRSIFYTGADLSTNFYRVFDVKTGFMGLDLNGLRHVITPSIGYSYNPEPTVSASKLLQIDSIDLLSSNNSASLGLSNKLQTKRKDANGKEARIDLVDLDITTSYAFAPRVVYGTTPVILYNNTVINPVDPAKKNKFNSPAFSDIFFKCKILPYSWLRLEGDANYKLSGVPGDSDYANYKHFSTVNYDVYFDFAPERSFGLGQRYARKGQSQITASFIWRLNPKWKVALYDRFNLKTYLDTSISPNVSVGQSLVEYQFTITRNLHCWDVDLTYGTSINNGSSIFLLFRLKAFPENEFGYNQQWHRPKSGA